MEKEFVTYEQALALKELDFDEPCLASYYHAGRRLYIAEYVKHGEYTVLAPLYQQAFRWFREKHSLKHNIEDDNNKGERFYYKIRSFDDEKFDNYYDVHVFIREEKDWSKIEFDSYDKAESACLGKLIEIVKGKENV